MAKEQKTSLSKAVKAAQRSNDDQALGPLVDRIVTGVTNMINRRFKPPTDRTEEIISALQGSLKNLEDRLLQFEKKEFEFPAPVDQVHVNLGPLETKLASLEKQIEKVVADRNVTWVFDHNRDSRGRPLQTIATPQQNHGT